MTECSTSQWIQFFRNAGLPLNVAANYAIIFYDNRIQLDMLMDLSKEYLYDMGIKVMGDVIAILRHAKEFHNQMVKEKMIGGTPADKKPTVTSRILNHYTRPSLVSRKPTVVQSSSPASQLPSVTRNISGLQRKRNLITLSGENSPDEAQMKKVRLLHPTANEAKECKVKMPSGTTERSRKLLQLQQQQSAKRSVFDRLGDSDVSSSTDVKFNKNTASVFRRLGPSSSGEVSTSTSLGEGTNDQDDDRPLQYQGILKKLSTVPRVTAQHKVVSVKKPTGVCTGKIIRLKSPSSLPEKSPASRRTVFQSAKDLALSNVNQINKILTQNSRSSARPALAARAVLGNRLKQISRTSVMNRVGFSKTAQISAKLGVGRGKVVVLKKPVVSKFGQADRASVFQRLG